MIFDQVLASCDAAQIDLADPIDVHVEWHVGSDTSTPEYADFSRTIGELEAEGERERLKGWAIIAYAEALKLEGAAAGKALAAARDTIQTLLQRQDLAGDAALGEILELIPKHPDYAN
jgi:Ca-activated chloride channel family protein